MLFSSFEFIFLFLPIALLAYFLIQARPLRVLALLLCSYLFYGFWNYKFLALLFFSTLVDFLLGIRIHEEANARRKKGLLVFSILVNLGVLGFFKYFNFFSANLTDLVRWFYPAFQNPYHLDVILPIGISFYTFISLSYTIDVYLGRSEPHRDFVAYAGFVCFYPHLVAGPLIRHNELVYQLEDPSRGRFDAHRFSHGVLLFIIGLTKKILIADRLADGVNPVLNSLAQLSTSEAWLCALGYTFQLYFDFSGYSDMAVGLAKMMNIEFPQNFDSPYKASSITEFWQRWHITLSQWLRDYLYIPLGGNRRGGIFTYRNLLLTMLIGGLWHGANWVFILWGAFHGILLVAERLARGSKLTSWVSRLPRFAKVGWTFFLVILGWVFFRSPDSDFAVQWFRILFVPTPTLSLHHFEPSFRDRFFAALLIAGALTWGAPNSRELVLDRFLKIRYAWLAAAGLLASCAFFSRNSPFLYFQF